DGRALHRGRPQRGLRAVLSARQSRGIGRQAGNPRLVRGGAGASGGEACLRAARRLNSRQGNRMNAVAHPLLSLPPLPWRAWAAKQTKAGVRGGRRSIFTPTSG